MFVGSLRVRSTVRVLAATEGKRNVAGVFMAERGEAGGELVSIATLARSLHAAGFAGRRIGQPASATTEFYLSTGGKAFTTFSVSRLTVMTRAMRRTAVLVLCACVWARRNSLNWGSY